MIIPPFAAAYPTRHDQGITSWTELIKIIFPSAFDTEFFPLRKYSRTAARAQKRPALIKFEAEWCEWCKKLDSEVFAQPQIIKALESYVCIKVDVDKQRNVALAYKISSLPRIIIVNIL